MSSDSNCSLTFLEVYLAAVLEYLMKEVLELAVEAAHRQKRKRVNPRVLGMVFEGDVE
jgi:hypothetical protein